MTRSIVFCLTAVFVFLLPLSTSAGNCDLVTPKSDKVILDAIKAEGFQLEPNRINPEKVGSSSLYRIRVDGNTWVLQIFPEKNAIKLTGVYGVPKGSISAGVINGWNHTRNFSKLSIDNDGDLWLVAEMGMQGGYTKEGLGSFLSTFKVSSMLLVQEVVLPAMSH